MLRLTEDVCRTAEHAPSTQGTQPFSRGRISPGSAIVTGLMVIHAALAWSGRQIGIRTGQDDAWYVLLARALRNFRYADLHVLGEPAHQLYPPGFPGALAVWSAMGGENTDWLIVLSVLCSVTVVAITYTISRRLVGPWGAVLCAAAVAFNPRLVERAGTVTSEPLFAVSALAAVALLAAPEPSRKRLIAAGALALLAGLTRTIGVVVIAALALHWLLERRWRAVAILTVAAACTIGVWLAWTTIAPDQFVGKSYIADMATVVRTHSPAQIVARRTPSAVEFYGGRALHSTLAVPTVPDTAIDNGVIGILLIIGLASGFIALLGRWRTGALYLLGYAVLLTYWPWRIERYLIPLVPLLIPTVLLGFASLGRVVRRPGWGTSVGAALIAATALSGVLKSSRLAVEGAHCDRGVEQQLQKCQPLEQRGFFEAIAYVNTHLREDAVVATVKSAPFYYYTGRQTPLVGALTSQSDSSFMPFVRQTGVSFILLARLQVSEHNRVGRRLRANCEELELEAEFPGPTLLLRVPTEAESTPNQDACEAIVRYQARRWRERA
jgi:MFS family permease